MSTSEARELFASMAKRLNAHFPGLAVLALIWAAVMLESSPIAAGPAGGGTLSIVEDEPVVEWDHRTASGAILHVTASIDDAISRNMTLPEWVAQLLEWFPPVTGDR